MSTSPDTRRRVAERLRARRDRIVRTRKRVLAAVGGTFALAWGVIFIQLVSGHDPALAKRAAASSGTGGSAGTSVVSSSSGSTGGGSSSSTASGSTGSTGSSATSPLTTSQS